MAKWLIIVGGFLLLIGLIAAFLSSHYADRVMGELKSGQLVFGPEAGTLEWQEKRRLRDQADILFYVSVAVTGLGVVLQTVGAVLSLTRSAVRRRSERTNPMWQPVRAIILLLLKPRRFVNVASDHDVAREFETNQQLREAYPNRQLPPDRRQGFEENARDRIGKIRRALSGAFAIVLLTVVAGLLAGLALNHVAGPPSRVLSMVLQLVAAGIILGATLSLLGWEILSWGGETLPEKVNRWLYRLLYALGTFVFVLAMSWQG